MLNTIIMGKICIQVGNCNKFFVCAYLLMKVGCLSYNSYQNNFLDYGMFIFLYVIKDDKLEKIGYNSKRPLCYIVYAKLYTYYMQIFHIIIIFYMFNNSLISN